MVFSATTAYCFFMREKITDVNFPNVKIGSQNTVLYKCILRANTPLLLRPLSVQTVFLKDIYQLQFEILDSFKKNPAARLMEEKSQQGIANSRVPVRPRSLVAFWFLGLCNNYGYVVMLAAAIDILSTNFHYTVNLLKEIRAASYQGLWISQANDIIQYGLKFKGMSRNASG
uniref:Uncharacterized protein n=1 Tax=Rhodnius prolixus TaxID=13249 RepID=T1HNT9_RHOPR